MLSTYVYDGTDAGSAACGSTAFSFLGTPMNQHYIYAFLDPRDGCPRYIGQGQGVRRHWWRRVKTNVDVQYGVEPWLCKLKDLGLEPVVIVVVQGLSKPQADAWEIGLIAMIGRLADETGPLKNLSTGGYGAAGCKRRPETCRRMSDALKAAWQRLEVKEHHEIARAKPEVKQRHAAAVRAALASPEVRQRISATGKAVRASPEVRRRMSAASRAALASPEVRQRLSKAIKSALSSPEVRQRMSATAKAALASPEARQRKVAALKAGLARPGVIQRRTTAIRAALARPGVIQRRTAAIKAAYAKPEVRQRVPAAVKAACAKPEVRRRKSEARKATLASPEARQRTSATAKAALASPEVRRRMSASAKAAWAKRKRLALQVQGGSVAEGDGVGQEAT
jgi:hypothetical protein